MVTLMNFNTAMNEVYTTSQLSRPSWGVNECITKGSAIVDVPYYEEDGVTVRYTMPEPFSGNVRYKDGEFTKYEPTDEDKAADDWFYWFPTPPNGES
jgi:hypothetical protein